MISSTTIKIENDMVILARRINYKYVKIDFGYEVKAHELIPYFNLPDEDFKKLVRRNTI